MGDFVSNLAGHFRFLQRPHSIRTRLIWLIAVSVLPLLALSGWLAASRAEAERQGIEARRFDLVNNLTFLIEREISHIEGVLLGLSTSPELGSGDFATFRRQAETVVASAELGVIAVLDKTGQQLVSTDLADGQPLPKRDDLTPIQAAFDGQNVVSQLTEGTASKRPVILITIPVRRDGQIVYALSAGLFPERLTKLFAEAGIPVNWTSAVVDRNGRFIARNLNPQQYIGKLARPELGRAAIGIANVGEFDNVNLEGIKTANSFRRSTITGWTSVVSVPKSVLNAPLYRTTTIFLLGAGALSLFSLAAAWLMAKSIVRPIRNLRATSLALVQGKPLPQAPSQIRELIEVRGAFEHSVSGLAHLAAVVASTGDAIISEDLDGKILTWNNGAERLFGYTPLEAIGKTMALINVSPAESATLTPPNRHIVEPEHSQMLCQRKDGTTVDVSLVVAPIQGSDGARIGLSTIAHDITAIKQTEQHQQFLMSELSHRSKNLLAVINSIANQTARSAGSIDEFQKRFAQRIQGLAASHDLLVKQNWAAASLANLVRMQLKTFVDERGASLSLIGPDVHVSVNAAQPLGLALHELATNSLKHGALSTANGKVEVRWGFFSSDDGSGKILRLVWQERGGPIVTPPTNKGFGSVVIERMVAQSLEGEVMMDFAPEGISWTLSMPARHIVDQNQPNTPQFRVSA